MTYQKDILSVKFYRTYSDNEPVRTWLKSLSSKNKKILGEDIKTVQFGWPLGMPLVKKLDHNLWEIRSKIDDGIARVIFTVADNSIILLHGFIKKSQKISKTDLNTALQRKKSIR